MSGRLAVAACLALAALASQCIAEVAEKDANGIHVLGHHNFKDTIDSQSVVVVYFHAKWCRKCPDFLKNLTETMKNCADLDNVAFASLNVDDALSLAEKYGIASYPGLLTFRDGDDFPYDSKDRSAKALTRMVRDFASKKWKKPHEVSDHLNMGNFEDTVQKGEGMLVKFYVRWCGHCRAMGPEWDKASRACLKLDPPMYMYKVDCEAEKDLCTLNKVDSYPTLRFYRDGKIVEPYRGQRKKDDFISYMRHKTGPPSKKLDATTKRLTEHIDALHKRSQPAIIGFFPDEEAAEFQTFELMARELRDKMEIVHVVSSDLGKKYGIEGKYGIYLSQPKHLRSKYEKESHVLSDFHDDKEELVSWLFSAARPLVGHLQPHNAGIDNIYWNMSVAGLYYTVDFGKEMLKSTQFWRNRLLKIANDYKHVKNLTFAVGDEESYAPLLQSINADNSFDVIFVISSPQSKHYHPIEEDWDEDAYRHHVDKYLGGTLNAYAKSEPIPMYNDGPVKVAVSLNFEKLYMNLDRHAVILFYQPWCPHCRTFEPIFLKVARKYKNNKNIIFMKYNLMENDAPHQFKEPIDGYPSTFFRYKNTETTQKFNGGSDLNTLEKFIEANLNHKDEL